jgi:chromosome partitioning protein
MQIMNIVVTSLKGGVGKSTTSIYLSAAAVERGYDPVTLIDADPQASSAEWLESWPIDGVSVVEAPSERTATRAVSRVDGLAVVDTPPGNERITQSIVALADAVVIPTRAGGVEYSRVIATLSLVPAKTPKGIVICAARLGTNDLEAAIAWWKEQKVDVWGIIPERVSIAAGPEARLSRDGLDGYDAVLQRALRGWR